MTKPFLYCLHWHSIGNQKACTGMTQIVETKVSEIVPFDYNFEMVRDVIRCNQLAEIISAYEAVKLSVITTFQQM